MRTGTSFGILLLLVLVVDLFLSLAQTANASAVSIPSIGKRSELRRRTTSEQAFLPWRRNLDNFAERVVESFRSAVLRGRDNENSHLLLSTLTLGGGRYRGWFLAAIGGSAVVSYLNEILNSEAVHRAIYFWVHAGPVVGHYKFTKWWLRKTNAPLEKRDRVYNNLHNQYANKCFHIALRLKGLYVKIAQVVSSRPDFIPPQYIDLFVAAQDSLPQIPIEEVVDIVDQSLRSEYGLSFHEVFEFMDEDALGSASIGQCHRAKLKKEFSQQDGYSGGEIAAVKVMHPGAEDRFRHDFQVFRLLCKIALTGWEPILDECYRQIMSEFDYRREANSLATVREYMSKSPFRKKVRIPEPQTSLCTKELLVMEMLDGRKLSDSLESELADALGSDRVFAREFIHRKRLELILGEENMRTLGISGGYEAFSKMNILTKLRLFRLYLRAQKVIDLMVDVQGYQMFRAGVFQGDPHPGNVLKLDDGTLGLIDYGQTKSISQDERLGISRIIKALGSGATNEEIASAMRQLGFKTRYNDDDTLAKYAALFFDSDVEGKKIGCPTPQSYFKVLTERDPLLSVPDVAIFVARSSFILRGMGTLLDKQVQTSTRWSTYAKEALGAIETQGNKRL